ncbi:MAG: ABC-F family ATP-binding cassette domain-containing protein [Saprospiraceae bacterium]|nr:ABC-F family ATP-binding cassette domain-containing protein [Saprospiraceae bacterium]
MLTFQDIFVKYGDRVVLDHVTLSIGNREKLGLIGRNGAGKSTLFKILSGNLVPDSGSVSMPNKSTIGFLHQEMNLPKGKTVIDETLTAFEELKEIQKEIVELEKEIAHRTDYTSDAYEKILIRHTDLVTQFEMMEGGNMQGNAERILKGLGFKQSDFQRLTDEFSGGWQMRIELAKMLLQKPNYLLLDEPTNHLDIESILWLEDFLSDYPGVVIIISHDRQFLDNVTNRTLELELGNIFDYRASYTKAMGMRAERREKQKSAYENQQKVIAQKERTITRFMAKASKTSMAQSMQKQLDKIERIEIDAEDTAVMNIRFQEPPRSGQIVVEAKHLTKNYGDLNVLRNVDFQIERGDRVAFVGQNGQGKTTLAKILINEIKATHGEVKLGHNVHLGYYAQNQAETLKPNLTLIETMEDHSPPEMRTKLRGILGSFLFSGEDVDKKVIVLSGGERARLAMACMMLRPINLLVLDEPTNHLDMLSKDMLKRAVQEYEGTLIVVSHDREFLRGLTDKTIEFRDHKLHTYLGDVDYFLEKRKLQDMRAVEMKEEKKPVKDASGKRTFTPEDWEKRKVLTREVQNAEKRITKLESDIEKAESKMAEPDFFDKPDHQDFIAKYQSLKAELDEVMEAWEEATVALEEFES